MKKIVGKCKQCGRCCMNIRLELTTTFDAEINILNHNFSEQLDSFISKHIKVNPFLDFSQVHTIEFSKKEGNDIKLMMYPVMCRHLKKKGNKYLCEMHDKEKPSYCKDYPSENSIILDGCGFKKVEVKKKK